MMSINPTSFCRGLYQILMQFCVLIMDKYTVDISY